jgi:hypothetical protein
VEWNGSVKMVPADRNFLRFSVLVSRRTSTAEAAMNKLSRFVLAMLGVTLLIAFIWGGFEYTWLKNARPNESQSAQLETKKLFAQVASLTREVDDLKKSVARGGHSQYQ